MPQAIADDWRASFRVPRASHGDALPSDGLTRAKTCRGWAETSEVVAMTCGRLVQMCRADALTREPGAMACGRMAMESRRFAVVCSGWETMRSGHRRSRAGGGRSCPPAGTSESPARRSRFTHAYSVQADCDYNRATMASRADRGRWFGCWMMGFLGCAIASIVLAWGCAIWSPVSAQTGILRHSLNDPLSREMVQHGEFDSFTYMSWRGFGWQRERVVGGRPTVPRSTGSLQRLRAGWPLLCMEGTRWRLDGQDVEYSLARLPNWSSVERHGLTRLPLRPNWSALLLNAILLGLPVHIAFASWGIRRVLRKRRGLCMRCGYDLRGAVGPDAVCPECGTTRPRSSAAIPHEDYSLTA